MSELTNGALAVIAGVAILISLGGILFSGKPTIFGFAGGSANVSFNLTEELSVSVTGAVNFGNGRVYANASSAILDSNLGNTYNWTNTTTAGPSIRTSVLAFDSNRNKTVLFGGGPFPFNTAYNDTWEYDGTSWTQINVASAPSARAFATTVFDSKRNVTVLFGGFSFSASELNDTWEYNGSAWTQINTVHAPPPRHFEGLAYDSLRNVTVLFGGGFNGITSYDYSDTWEYNGTDWKNVTVPGPSDRQVQMTFDSNRNVTVLFGGYSQVLGVTYSDTWEYNGSAWNQITTPTTPTGTRITTPVYDPVDKLTLMFGGITYSGGFTGLNDTWIYNGNDWSQLSTSSAPSPRIAGADYDSKRNKFVLFGGTEDAATNAYNDTWEFDYSSVAIGTVNGTWSFNPQYIYIENDGTVNESVNVTSDKNAASFLGGTSPSYQIKGVTTQAGACAGTFQSSYFDLLTAQQNICSLLQYDTSAHKFETPVKLVVPSDAAPGQKNSVITFSVTKV